MGKRVLFFIVKFGEGPVLVWGICANRVFNAGWKSVNKRQIRFPEENLTRALFRSLKSKAQMSFPDPIYL